MNRFKIYNIVPKSIYELIYDDAIKLFDPRLIDTLNSLYNHYGFDIIINNWANGGEFQYRGYRNKNCGVGVPGGSHYQGKALDMDFYRKGEKIDPSKMIEYIIRDRALFPNIRGIEIGVNWVHIDIMDETDSIYRRGVNNGKILLFHPTDASQNKII